MPFTIEDPHAGANIESLAVGLNIDKALFTIVVTGNKSAVANLVKQLGKLVKVTDHHAWKGCVRGHCVQFNWVS